jgi:TolA-binding protein
VSAKSKPPEKLRAQLNEAWSHRVNHRLEDAEAAFRAILTRYPEEVDAIYGLGLVLMEKGEDKKAVKQFKEAVRLLEAGAFGKDELRAGLLRWQILGHIDRVTKGDWNLSKISNVMPE